MITTQHGQQPDEQLMLAYQAGQQKPLMNCINVIVSLFLPI